MKELSLVFPCFHEEDHLESSIEQVIQTMQAAKIDFEIILVDDFSSDRTAEIIDVLIQKYPVHSIVKVLHSSNQGRGAAFLSGFERSTGEIVGYFDIDLEVSPVYVVECLRLFRFHDADMVIGERIYKVSASLVYRHLLSIIYSKLVHFTLGIPSRIDSESGYKFFKRNVLAAYQGRFLNKGWFWDTEVVARFLRDNKKIVTFPCLFVRDGTKRSTVKPLRDSIEYIRCLSTFIQSPKDFKK